MHDVLRFLFIIQQCKLLISINLFDYAIAGPIWFEPVHYILFLFGGLLSEKPIVHITLSLR